MEDLEIGGTTAPVKPLARKGKAAPRVDIAMTDGTSALALEITVELPLEGTIEPERMATVEQDKRLAVFSTPGALEPILTVIETVARKHVPDLTTDKGRKAIASLAANVAKCKVRLDDAGKELVAELKALPTAIDANRRAMRERLDALRDESRAPLTAWEEGQERQHQFVAGIQAMPGQNQGATAERLQEVINALKARDLLQAPDFAEEVLTAQQLALKDLEGMLALRRQADADAAELARLRKEALERQAQEAEAQRIRDAEVRARQDAEEAQARAEREKTEAQARLQEAEASAARERQASAEREEQARIEATQEAERRQRAAAQAEQDATAERERNKQHRLTIHTEALQDLMTNAGLNHDQARAVIIAVAQKTINHISINY